MVPGEAAHMWDMRTQGRQPASITVMDKNIVIQARKEKGKMMDAI